MAEDRWTFADVLSELRATTRERDEARATKDMHKERYQQVLAMLDREREVRRGLVEKALAVIAGIDQWNEDVQKIIGRVPNYRWGGLEELRAALAAAAKLDGEPSA